MQIGGVNHNCHESGVCFNDMHRLKFGVFNDCWKRWRHSQWEKSNIRPTDVDFLIEQKGNFLMMEFKSNSSVFNMSSGQGIMFKQLAACADVSVILCEGLAKDMIVRKISIISKGYCSDPLPATIENLQSILESWSKWADTHPKTPSHLNSAKPEWLNLN